MTNHLKAALLGAISICLIGGIAWAKEREPVGKVVAIKGEALITHYKSSEAIPLKLNDSIFVRDAIETKEGAKIKIRFVDDSVILLSESSTIDIARYRYAPKQEVRESILKLILGKVRSITSRVFSGPGSRFEVHTANAVAGVRGTDFIVWALTNGETMVAVLKGQVSVFNPVLITKGQMIRVEEGEAPSRPFAPPRIIQKEELDQGALNQEWQEGWRR